MNRLEELVKGARTIAVSGHIRPDGDCVGSVLAVSRYLKCTMPEAQVWTILQKPPLVFHCLAGVEEIHTPVEFMGGRKKAPEVFDAFIMLDGEASRMGDILPVFERAALKINIDHHISNPGTGDINVLLPEASSTCEVVYGLMDPGKLDAEMAKALYLGIAHDTGVFRYSNTSPKTLRIVAELIGYGFDFTKLIDDTYYKKTYLQSQILGRALLESVRFMDGGCIFSVIHKKTMDFYGVSLGDLSGIIDQLRIIEGVECAIFMYELNTLEYKVSMRSNEWIDVARVAAYFGGGGHVRAAGCTMQGTSHDVINNLSEQIAQQWRKEC
ncbi:MAG: bifunctional oligoribonuclease/PAP phosphatase NrnA [Lachnospiraceae bacterium]|nr:bifunctional oligoribonuclease/PAP phosphatase NrnA [Lachnospiraceae bacterium]